MEVRKLTRAARRCKELKWRVRVSGWSVTLLISINVNGRWNCRGAGGREFHCELKGLTREYKPKVVALLGRGLAGRRRTAYVRDWRRRGGQDRKRLALAGVCGYYRMRRMLG